MSQVKSSLKGFNPFLTRVDSSKQTGFDKYYIDREVKTVFKSTGQEDEDGHALGIAEDIVIDKKIDIQEFLDAQADSVGIDYYIKALTLQGDSIDNYATQINENVVDYSECPDNLADTMLLGDKAKAAFLAMDPALRGNHTTIEGFLNSLSKESLETYIKGIIEAQMPKKEGD